ncbi:MAG: hypothetical protein EZS28_009152 [Streblomastix strix]|uniref:Ubiquitin-like protease family profile domain-containing protein n=1 Tax=Streblomastix strix TaxID=222440 RepID=A0A5J4WM26_9EUKA|nr:MAG: hypothetical protein EZS28_009152 [Streblomastix strix]
MDKDKRLPNAIIGSSPLSSQLQSMDSPPEFVSKIPVNQEIRQGGYDENYYEKDQKVIKERFGVTLRKYDLHTLFGHEWLNDEIINYFIELLKEKNERGNQLYMDCVCEQEMIMNELDEEDVYEEEYEYEDEDDKEDEIDLFVDLIQKDNRIQSNNICAWRDTPLPKCHTMNTFFYEKLIMTMRRPERDIIIKNKEKERRIKQSEKNNDENKERQKLQGKELRMVRDNEMEKDQKQKQYPIPASFLPSTGLTSSQQSQSQSFDKIIIPIHRSQHWTVAVINMRLRRLEYYDSLNYQYIPILTRLCKWMDDEYKDKIISKRGNEKEKGIQVGQINRNIQEDENEEIYPEIEGFDFSEWYSNGIQDQQKWRKHLYERNIMREERQQRRKQIETQIKEGNESKEKKKDKEIELKEMDINEQHIVETDKEEDQIEHERVYSRVVGSSYRPESMPKQKNYFDCGVFMMCVVERLMRNAPLRFSQNSIQATREALIKLFAEEETLEI